RQMHATGAGGDRGVDTIVHENPRGRAGDRTHHLPHPPRERGVGQIALPDLDAVDSAVGGADGACNQVVAAQTKASAIGDAMPDHDASRRRARAAITDPSSASRASAVTTPTPVTPPRAYGLF